MSVLSARGACLCGAVSFALRFPSKWVAHCHCTRCQRAHGAAFVTWVGMDAASVEIADPGAALRWFSPAGDADRGFCGICGSSMFFQSRRWPGELHVARALIADRVDREPQGHAYFDTHVSWVRVDDQLPATPDPDANER